MKALYLKGILSKMQNVNEDQTILSRPGKIKRISAKPISYTERHRGVWFKPEYDLEEIQIAQDTDSFLFRAIKKKVNRFVTAGWEIVGEKKEVVEYVKKRIREIEYVSNTPWNLLLSYTATDLIRFSNCMWVKSRSIASSSGKVRKIFEKKEVDPVAGYFILPFETLSFKTKRNGEIKKIRQRMPSGEERYFNPEDVVHFYDNKKPGFAMGTPELVPVLDDIALLRRLEENVEDLIESNLYPLFHYQIGSDTFPERYSPEGYKETDIVKNTIEYMPAGGIYVSDHRHKIQAIGSEGRALRIEGYLDYFKKRVIAGLGLSSVDMGEGDTANRSTANALSQSAIQDVEALQRTMKTIIEFFIFNELLLEGGYDPLEPENRIEIKFGVVDRETRSKLENQTIQLFLNNLLSENEARQRLGYAPDVDKEDTNHYHYTKPLAMLKLGIVDGEPIGNIGRPEVDPSGARNTSENTSRPTNQHGTRTAPKLSSDNLLEIISETIDYISTEYDNALDIAKLSALEYNQKEIKKKKFVLNYLEDIKKQGIELSSISDGYLVDNNYIRGKMLEHCKKISLMYINAVRQNEVEND